MSIREDAHQMHDDLVRLRHALHAEPEIGLALPKTQEKVLNALEGLPLEVTLGRSLSSVTAVLRGGRPGPAVLLRGDMDALPVQERTGLAFAATNGRMHACGHDLHASMLVGAAHLLATRRDRLAGDVVFMFQPGEEGCDGARLMVEEGVLDAAGPRVSAAYGLHVASSSLPSGTFSTRRGPLLAACDAVHIVVEGAGGHGSAPHRANDPIPAACEMVTALQTFVTRSFDPFDPVVLSVCRLSSGTATNVIPDRVELDATVRSFSRANHERVREGFIRTCEGVAHAHGLDVRVEYVEQYPVTSNDAAEAEFAARVISDVHDADRFIWAPQPGTGSEDFSRVLDEVPGAFVLLGACPEDRDPAGAPYNHSPLARFDDRVLADGAAVYAELAARRLAELTPTS